MTKEKIMYDSPEAAQRVTLSGWISKDGIFWPDKHDPKFAEHHARWGGCTHVRCDCGAETEKHYTKCLACRNKADDERYAAMPFKEWEGEPLCLYRDDTYFFSEEELLDWADVHGIEDFSTIQLVICKPETAWELEPDEIYTDYLPEDQYTHDVAPKTAAAFEELNKVIREEKEILCWLPGKNRTTYKPTKGTDNA